MEFDCLKNSLFKHAAIYTVPSFLNAGISIFILPVMTRYLTPSEYGILANFNALLAVMAILVGFSSQGAITVNYFKLPKEHLSEYVANVSILIISSLAVIVFILLMFYGVFEERFGLPKVWAVMAALLAGCNLVTLINLALWQAEQQSKPFATLQVASVVLNVAFSILFVVSFSWGWQGRVLGSGLAIFIFSIVSGIFLYKRGYLSFRFNREYLKDAFSFGVPLIPHQLSFWLRTGIDRFILALMVSTSATGLYNVSFQVGSMLGLALTAFNQAWSPHLYKKLGSVDEDEKRKLVKFTYLYFAAVLTVAFASMVLLPPVLNFFVGEKYRGASAFLGYICFGFAFQGMYFMVGNYVFYAKKTAPLSLITFSCGVIHVVICYFLVEKNGAIGAAQTFSITSLLTFLGVWRLSAKVYRMPWSLWKRA